MQVRWLRLSSTFEALENHFPHGLLTIFKFFLLMLAIGHVTACLFYFMAVLDNLDGLSWPAKVSLTNLNIETVIYAVFASITDFFEQLFWSSPLRLHVSSSTQFIRP